MVNFRSAACGDEKSRQPFALSVCICNLEIAWNFICKQKSDVLLTELGRIDSKYLGEKKDIPDPHTHPLPAHSPTRKVWNYSTLSCTRPKCRFLFVMMPSVVWKMETLRYQPWMWYCTCISQQWKCEQLFLINVKFPGVHVRSFVGLLHFSAQVASQVIFCLIGFSTFVIGTISFSVTSLSFRKKGRVVVCCILNLCEKRTSRVSMVCCSSVLVEVFRVRPVKYR